MNNMFTNYNWTGLTMLKADKIHTDNIGHCSIVKGKTSCYQIGIKLSGITEIVYNDIPYDYSDGHILYLPKESDPNAVYKRTIATVGDSSFVFFDSLYELPKTPVSIPCPSDSQIAKQFVKIAWQFKQGDLISSMASFYKLIKMISEIAEISYSDQAQADRLLPATQYISEHLHDTFIDIDYLSDLCNMTPGYFKHRFKTILGIAPLQYINQQKCICAEKLLADTDYEVQEIARMIGIYDANYFSRFFKQHTDFTPMQYRIIHQKQL